MLYHSTNPHGGDIYGGTVRLDFSANLNPYGTPPEVLQAVREVLPNLWRYPDPYCRELVGAIARFEGVPEGAVLCGNGAAELIYAFCAALHPRRAVELAPTFSEYSLALSQFGGVMARYPLRKETGFTLDAGFLDFLAAEQPDAVFLCNPNNPTGVVIDPALLQSILAFCGKAGIHVLLDECFLDLSDAGESMKHALSDNPGLLILKAFTKSYGMAGLRLGYCLSRNAALLEAMANTVQPWNVSLPAQAAGIAALGAQSFLEKARAAIARERPWLTKQLEAQGFWVCPSAANFLLFQGPVCLHDALKIQGIAIRRCDNFHGLSGGWFRTAVKRHEENEALIRAIQQREA